MDSIRQAYTTLEQELDALDQRRGEIDGLLAHMRKAFPDLEDDVDDEDDEAPPKKAGSKRNKQTNKQTNKARGGPPGNAEPP